MYKANTEMLSQAAKVRNIPHIIVRDLKIDYSNAIECCPNCGNTKPIFFQFQNGMFICFICRKASNSADDLVQAF